MLPQNLHHSSDEQDGYTRVERNEKHVIVDASGRLCEDAEVLARVEAMVIPPMWSDVWICTTADGHLQCTGRDAKRRKQYIYHEAYTSYRQRAKFERLGAFGEALPHLRSEVDKSLRSGNWTRERMLALVVFMLDRTHLRIGNERYQELHDTYGLTTLRRKHIHEEGRNLLLQFKGKSNQFRNVSIKNRRLRKLVLEVASLPGYELFKYKDSSGHAQRLDSSDVNDYLHEHMGEKFSAKDFRTWAGTTLAVRFYGEAVRSQAEKETGALATKLVRLVAAELGNTVSVCREYYIHPKILELATTGQLVAKDWPAEPEGHALAGYEKEAMRLIYP